VQELPAIAGARCENRLSAWFKCLTVTAGPDDYAGEVLRIVDGFVRYDRDRFLKAARRTANADQRKALDAASSRLET